jgi:Protein of unknown function (DUF4054)
VPTPVITSASVKMRFPFLRDVPDALVQFALEEALIQCDAAQLGSYYSAAVLYMTAHIIVRAQQVLEGGAGMPLKSVSVGGEISYTYDNPDTPKLTDASDLATTSFGMRFLEYVTLSVPAVAVI